MLFRDSEFFFFWQIVSFFSSFVGRLASTDRKKLQITKKKNGGALVILNLSSSSVLNQMPTRASFRLSFVGIVYFLSKNLYLPEDRPRP